MFFEDGDFNAGAREQIGQHHPGGAAARDNALRVEISGHWRYDLQRELSRPL